MNALTRIEAQQDKDVLMSALRDSIYPGAKESSIEMVLAYCKAGGLDPLTKPVHIVPMWDKNTKVMRDTVMPGIGLYRIIADRGGKYAGQDDAVFGPEMEGWGIKFPQWCKVTVWKASAVGRVPYSAKVFWLESYSVAGKDTDAPNVMWKKRPYGQLEKCAEAAALRKAFPEIGSQPTADEMAGKELAVDVIDAIPAAPALAAPDKLSRSEALKRQIRSTPITAENSRNVSTLHAALADGEILDAETGEVTHNQAAGLILLIEAAATRAELEHHRPAVAALKGDAKRQAVAAWKAAEARLTESEPAAPVAA